MRLPVQWREARCGVTAIFLFACVTASAQTATLSGRIVDSESREALPFTNVFVNNTTIGTAADANGAFRLSGIPAGPGEIVFSFVGYQLFKLRVDLKPGQIMQTEVRLIADGKILENVKIEGKRDKIWENQFKRFTKTFLGSGKRADQCRILNPWALEFKEDGKNLAAEARQVLEIENNSLGYKIFYALKKFTTDGQSYAIIGDGRFENMKPADEKISEKWNRNRLNAYLGSQRHLMRALLTNTIRRENFRLYVDKVGFENSPKYAVFARELERSIEVFDTTRIQMIKGSSVNSVQISLPRKLEVHYVAGVSRITSYDDVIYPVSWLELRKGTVKVNEQGIVLDPENIIASGYIASLRMADMLPNNYQPTQAEVDQVVIKPTIEYFEKTYVHTDKPYYYPGERIWFKVYMNYYFQPVRDSLSKVLHLELIDPSRKIIATKILPLDSGLTSGDFSLADTIRSGNYFLRAYTQFQRNFGNKNLRMVPIPVLKATSKPEYVQETSNLSDKLIVTTDKPSYTKREKVTLAIKLDEEESGPIPGNFSISVTDASQVMQIGNGGGIRDQFPIRDDEHVKSPEKLWRVEKGMTIRGQFLNAKGKGVKTQLNVIQFAPNRVMIVDTDELGFFDVTDLQFYGLCSFSIQPSKTGKLSATGKVRLIPPEMPPVVVDAKEQPIPMMEMNSVQRILSVYEKPDDSRMLAEVEVKGTRESATLENVASTARPYGKPDYAFDETRIKTQFPNLLYTLQALNVPGLVVNPNTATVFFARNSKPVLYVAPGATVEEIEKQYTPLVTVDNMPMTGGSAGEILQSIPPDYVASIELTKGGSSIRGTQAPFGVIAVYTKKKILTAQSSANLNLITVEGYALPERFVHPNYEYPSPEHSSPDYRSTLYWNPSVSIGSSGSPAEVSFYTSDLTGTYRIVVEGVNGKGEPVRSVTFIKVDE